MCKLHEDYIYSAIKLQTNAGTVNTRKVVLMQVKEKARIFLSLSQRDERAFKMEPKVKYEYSMLRMIVGEINEESNEISSYVCDAYQNERDISCEGIFEKGVYGVYVEADWKQDFCRSLVLSSYGEIGVSFEEVELDAATTDQILDGLLRIHQDFSDKEKVQHYEDNIIKARGIVGGYMYFYYQNKTSNTKLKESVQMNNLLNLTIMEPFHNSHCYEVEVCQMQNLLVKYQITAGSYSFENKMKYSLIKEYSDEELKELARNKAQKVQKRQMEGEEIEVVIHTY